MANARPPPPVPTSKVAGTRFAAATPRHCTTDFFSSSGKFSFLQIIFIASSSSLFVKHKERNKSSPHRMRISAEEQGILFESLPLSGVQVEASEFDESSVVLIYSETEPEAVTATVIPQRRTIKTPVLPSRCASVRTVQKYLMSTLMVHHNVEFESANKMATKWNLGRGHSLRGLSAEKFTEDFGKIRGPHLHWAVQEDLQMEQELNDQKIIQEWQETKEFLIWRGKLRLSCAPLLSSVCNTPWPVKLTRNI